MDKSKRFLIGCIILAASILIVGSNIVNSIISVNNRAFDFECNGSSDAYVFVQDKEYLNEEEAKWYLGFNVPNLVENDEYWGDLLASGALSGTFTEFSHHFPADEADDGEAYTDTIRIYSRQKLDKFMAERLP